MKKKEYVRPNIVVRNVNVKKYSILRASFTGLRKGEACENWTDNMNDVLGGDGGSFHNGFEVNNEIWGDNTKL